MLHSLQLNPLAKEFKIPGASSSTAAAAAAPSRLQVSSAAVGAPSAPADASSSTAVVPTSDATASSNAGAGSSTSAAEGATVEVDSASTVAETGDGAATPPVVGQTPSQRDTSPMAVQADQGILGATATATSSPASVASHEGRVDSSNRTSDSGPARGSDSNASTPASNRLGSTISIIGPPSALDDLPEDHVFDVVLLAGCNSEQLQTIYRNPATPV